MTSPMQQQISAMAAQALAAHGLVLVQARLAGSGRYLTLQVLAENPDGSSPGLDDCARASRTLSAQLDVADIINGRYVLEVSSPGLDRPLTTLEDYTRYIGRHVRLAFTDKQPLNGSQVGGTSGHLVGTDAHQDVIVIHPDDSRETLTIPFKSLRSGHLDASPAELALYMKKQPLPGEIIPITAVDDEPPVMNA